jgi:hypothetical protein
MKTAVIGDDADRLVVYSRALVGARHYGFQQRACRPYRRKTKGKVERPFRYIRGDFFLAGSFRNLEEVELAITRQPALAPSPQPRPAPTGQALIARPPVGDKAGRGVELRSNGRGCHAGRSPPTRFVSSFMRSPTISAIFCARWRRQSRSRSGR